MPEGLQHDTMETSLQIHARHLERTPTAGCKDPRHRHPPIWMSPLSSVVVYTAKPGKWVSCRTDRSGWLTVGVYVKNSRTRIQAISQHQTRSALQQTPFIPKVPSHHFHHSSKDMLYPMVSSPMLLPFYKIVQVLQNLVCSNLEQYLAQTMHMIFICLGRWDIFLPEC